MIERTKNIIRFITSQKTLRIVGVLLLLGILWSVDVRQVLKRLSGVSIPLVVVGALLGFPLKFVRSFRWNQIKSFLEVDSTPLRSFFLQLVAGMAMFTPAKVGDFVKTFYLKGDGYSMTRTAVSVIGDRLMDLFVILTIAISAGFYFLPIEVLRSWGWYLAGPVTLVIGLGFMSYFRNVSYRLTRTLFRFIIPNQMHVKAKKIVDETTRYMKKLSWKHLAYYTAISILAFFFQVWRIQFFTRSLGFRVPLLTLGGIIAIMSISNLLPITFSGVGTREAVFVYCFGQINVDPESAISLSLIMLGTNLFNGALGSLLFILFPPAFSFSDFSRSMNNEQA